MCHTSVTAENGDRYPSLVPSDPEEDPYDLLKFRRSVDYEASRASSEIEPEEAVAAKMSAWRAGRDARRSAAQGNGSLGSSSDHSRRSGDLHVSFSDEVGASDGLEMSSAAEAPHAVPKKLEYVHPFAVPSPRGDFKPREVLPLDRPHPFALAEGIPRSLSAPPPPAPPPPTPTPSLITKDDATAMNGSRQGNTHHHDSLARAKQLSDKLAHWL